MKILINTPDINKLGGVANHYKGLKPYWSEDVHYNFIAGRKNMPGFVLLPFDLVIFFFKLLFGNFDVVLLNPSLGKTALKRDALFLKIASWFDVKKIIFFHGWEDVLADDISNKPSWFLKNYNNADVFLVLASDFKKQMEYWGIKKPILLTTTKVDDCLVSSFMIEDKPFNNTLLFLARVEENKGIFVAIDTLRFLQKKHPNLRMLVAGDGGALELAKNYVKTHNVDNVEFLGNISSDHLINAFTTADIYLLPTWHGEGMPTSILEAMAFGLPIITRPVGGTVDFFENKKMGVLIPTKDPEDFSSAIEKLLINHELLNNISRYNHNYAKQNFMASQVTKSLEQIMKSL